MNYWKLNSDWENRNKAAEKTRKGHIVQTSYRSYKDNPFLLELMGLYLDDLMMFQIETYHHIFELKLQQRLKNISRSATVNGFNVSCMPDQIHCKTHSHWMCQPGPYKRNHLLCKRHEGVVPKYWNKSNVIHKRYMEKSKRNFNKTKFLLQTVPSQEILQQNLIFSTSCPLPIKKPLTSRRFSRNKLSIKPDSFYKPFPY